MDLMNMHYTLRAFSVPKTAAAIVRTQVGSRRRVHYYIIVGDGKASGQLAAARWYQFMETMSSLIVADVR